MGYTHYYRDARPLNDAQWKAFCADCEGLFASAKVPLANGDGKRGTKPVIADDYVAFNGVGSDSHETAFCSKDGRDFDFCKTAEKPYDAVVVEFFKLIRKHAGASLSSDGGEEIFGKK